MFRGQEDYAEHPVVCLKMTEVKPTCILLLSSVKKMENYITSFLNIISAI